MHCPLIGKLFNLPSSPVPANSFLRPQDANLEPLCTQCSSTITEGIFPRLTSTPLTLTLTCPPVLPFQLVILFSSLIVLPAGSTLRACSWHFLGWSLCPLLAPLLLPVASRLISKGYRFTPSKMSLIFMSLPHSKGVPSPQCPPDPKDTMTHHIIMFPEHFHHARCSGLPLPASFPSCPREPGLPPFLHSTFPHSTHSFLNLPFLQLTSINELPLHPYLLCTM